MGYALSWVAVKGPTPETVQAFLHLRPTGERSEVPESDVDGVKLPGGWYVVVTNRDFTFVKDDLLESLSALGEVIMCYVEEHVMASGAAGWRDGKCIWSLTHDSQKSVYHLDVKGEPPPPFDDIYDRLDQDQNEAGGENAEGDYIFDVPVALAKALTSFVHNEDPPSLVEDEDPFEILESTKPKPKTIWKRLFGG